MFNMRIGNFRFLVILIFVINKIYVTHIRIITFDFFFYFTINKYKIYKTFCYPIKKDC